MESSTRIIGGGIRRHSGLQGKEYIHKTGRGYQEVKQGNTAGWTWKWKDGHEKDECPQLLLHPNPNHLSQASTNIQVNTAKERKVQFTIWHGARKHVACLRTIKSLVENMIIGVTKGFLYKMRLVYAHFPINAIPNDDGSHLQIRNFCTSNCWNTWNEREEAND